MKKSVYLRGKIGTCWYNFTEGIAYLLTYKRTPKNLLYGRHLPYGEEKKQYLNTYCRKDLIAKSKPLFIYVHGGGWISGITDMRNAYIQNFANEGYFTASISYSYAPKKVFPEPIREICAAIDRIFDMAEEKNIDTSRIVLSGESAGVYYIFYLAALAADNSLAEKIGVKFEHISDFKPRAMVAHCGCVNLEHLLDKNLPQSRFPDIKMMTCSFLGKPMKEAREYLATEEGKLASPSITKGFPPAFFTTGDKDWLRYEGYDMMKKYDELGIKYEHFEGTKALGNHAWTIVTKLKQGRRCLEKTLAFLKTMLPGD
ncbi:MAG: alpha/beta hydrolase [Clostridia bacterium]|nr:alpha/beta hydrolase [Clostridia bacterium]